MKARVYSKHILPGYAVARAEEPIRAPFILPEACCRNEVLPGQSAANYGFSFISSYHFLILSTARMPIKEELKRNLHEEILSGGNYILSCFGC